ncbi:MAG: transglycosylase SLT domain-containing protein [bacterium]
MKSLFLYSLILIIILLNFIVVFDYIHIAKADIVIHEYQSAETLEEYILKEAGQKGLYIAYCESRLNPLATNSNSTAKGLYQFIDKTWGNYCEGEVFNPVDNLNCFKKLYPLHPEWWQCQ